MIIKNCENEVYQFKRVNQNLNQMIDFYSKTLTLEDYINLNILEYLDSEDHFEKRPNTLQFNSENKINRYALKDQILSDTQVIESALL